MIKRLGIFLLVLQLVVVMVACGPAGTSGTGDTGQKDTGTQGTPQQEMPVVSLLHNINTTITDGDLVAEAASDYTAEKIGVKLKFTRVEQSVFKEQTRLMLMSREPVDMFVVSSSTNIGDLTNQVADGMLMPLEDYLPEQGKEMLKVFEGMDERFLKSGFVQGHQYFIPCLREMAKSRILTFNKKMAEDNGIDLKSIKTFDDVEKAFEIVKKNNPDIYCISSFSGMTMGNFTTCDRLVDYFGVLMDFGQSDEIVNYFETEEYEYLVKLAREWYLAEYFPPDILSEAMQGTFKDRMKAGTLFSYINNGKPLIDAQETARCGIETESVEIVPGVCATDSVNNYNWAVTSYSKYGAECVKVLNLMYSDPGFHNLLCKGIEGTHWAWSEDGKTIEYPEGVTAETNGYNLASDFLWGNLYITHPWKGNPVDLYSAQYPEYVKNSMVSNALGFLFDKTHIATEYAAVTNVYNEYARALEFGVVDPETELPKFREELKRNGLDKVIAEKQRQYNEWRAGK